MQTATSHRVSKMDLATANEPLNPMAPSTQNPKSRGSKTSGSVVGDFSSFIFYFFFTNEQAVSEPRPDASQASPPTYQTATAGTHFGLRPSINEKSSAQHRSTHSSRAPSIPSFHSSASVPRTTSKALTSRSGSVVSFRPSPSLESSHVSRRSSQVSRPISRTYSVHNLEDPSPYLSQSTHGSWPPQYQSFQPPNDGDDQSDEHSLSGSQFPQEGHGNERPVCDIEPNIDEISPDEDDRMARRALQGTNKHGNNLILTR